MTANKEDDMLFDENELNQLNQYLVKYPDDQMIDQTIDTLRQYVPEKKKRSTFNVGRIKEWIKRAKVEVQFIRPLFWIMSILLFVFGFIITKQLQNNPILTLIIIGPLPFIFGLLEVFRGRDANLLEMELACKLSAFEIILTRLLIVSIFNFSLTLLSTIALSGYNQQENLIEMLLIWLGPFTLFVAGALFLSIRFRGAIFMPMFLSIWIIFSLSLISDGTWSEKLLTFDLPFHLTLIVVGLLLAGLQLKYLNVKFDWYKEDGIIGTSY